jgi:hypothetical protein
MTKREIIYTVFEKLNIMTDDANLSEELVSSLIDTKRAMLLKQQYGVKAWHMPIEVKQEICMSLELVNKIDGYSCAGKIVSTSVALPKSIKIKGKEGPLNVRLLDGTSIPLNIVSIERVPFLFENPYTRHITYCAVDFSGKLFFMSADNKSRHLKHIKVTDVFEQPDIARDLQCNKDETVEAWDDEYPMESAMVDTAMDLIVKDLVGTLSIPTDDNNNATDDTGVQGR